LVNKFPFLGIMKIKSSQRNLFSILILSFVLLAASAPAFGDVPAMSFDSLGSGQNYYQNQSYSLGWKFQTNQGIEVTALGFYDDLANGLTESHPVGIFDASNSQLVRSVTVTNSDPLTGFFHFHSIAPIFLPAGHEYYVTSVTGTEKYAISVTTLNLDSSITYEGFAAYGPNAETPTHTLTCPDKYSANTFHGDFGPSFEILNGSNKEGTAISLFCNRSGVNLELADCSVTVGDTGAPPRNTPTGTVTFTASNGVSPASGQCNLQQTPFSPGVASCNVQFTLPANYPIGVAFPIDATYPGTTQFEAASTSHSLIQAGCIGDPGDPCPGAVALTFSDLPQILKNTLSTIFECGSATASARTGQPATAPGLIGSIGQCVGALSLNTQLPEIMAGMDQSQLSALIGSISKKDAQNDTVLAALKSLGDTSNQQQLQDAINDQTKLTQLMQKLINEQIKLNHGIIHNLKGYEVAFATKPKLNIQIGTADISVKNNTRKTIKVKLTKFGARLATLLKTAGKRELDLTVTMKGKRAKGPKHPFNSTQTINVGN
jgi:hypothetical protein